MRGRYSYLARATPRRVIESSQAASWNMYDTVSYVMSLNPIGEDGTEKRQTQSRIFEDAADTSHEAS